MIFDPIKMEFIFKAAVLHEIGGPFNVEEVDLLPPQPGEVRVRLGAASLCHSDWHFVTGHFKRPLPLVLGHEGGFKRGVIIFD